MHERILDQPHDSDHEENVVPEEVAAEIGEALASDERLTSLRERQKEIRQKGDVRADEQIVKEIRAVRDEVTEGILRGHGLYEDPANVEAQSEQERQKTLHEIGSSLRGDESPEELERVFGLVGEEGKLTIESPLFRTETKRAFGDYLNLARSFDVASQLELKMGITVKNTGRASVERRRMHNAVAELVATDLTLDFDAARGLVAKIREDRLPGSRESKAYARGIAKQIERYGGDMDLWSKVEYEDFQERLKARRSD